jgi:hypothetical protein
MLSTEMEEEEEEDVVVAVVAAMVAVAAGPGTARRAERPKICGCWRGCWPQRGPHRYRRHLLRAGSAALSP